MRLWVYYFSLLFTASSFAKSDYSNEITCLDNYKFQLDQKRVYKINRFNTYLLLITASEGALDSEHQEGFLQLEKESLKFCYLPWSKSKEFLNFSVVNSFGELQKMSYHVDRKYTLNEMGSLQSLNPFSSIRPKCVDIDAAKALNKIHVTLDKAITQDRLPASDSASPNFNKLLNYQLPEGCNKIIFLQQKVNAFDKRFEKYNKFLKPKE